MPREESRAVAEGNDPITQDAYKWEELRRVVSKTWGEAITEYNKDLRRIDY